MKNNSKEIGKKLYRVYYNDISKSFEIRDYDIKSTNKDGVFYINPNSIKLIYTNPNSIKIDPTEFESFDYIAEYQDHSIFGENFVKFKALNHVLGMHLCDAVYMMTFIHKENAEEFIETYQDLLNVKDLSNYYDMIDPKSTYSGLKQLTDLNESIRAIVNCKDIYKTDSIKDFLYTYISDVVDICETLKSSEPKKVEVKS